MERGDGEVGRLCGARDAKEKRKREQEKERSLHALLMSWNLRSLARGIF